MHVPADGLNREGKPLGVVFNSAFMVKVCTADDVDAEWDDCLAAFRKLLLRKWVRHSPRKNKKIDE